MKILQGVFQHPDPQSVEVLVFVSSLEAMSPEARLLVDMGRHAASSTCARRNAALERSEVAFAIDIFVC